MTKPLQWKSGVLRAILREAGISAEEFIKLI